MADASPQRPDNALSRVRAARAVRPVSTPSWHAEDRPGSVTAYDEIWYQGRPQLP